MFKGVEGGKGGLTWRGNTFTATNVTLKTLLQFAYGPAAADGISVRNLEAYRIVDGPSWIDTERFNIDAKTEGQQPASTISLMLRALLIDRFALKAKLETRETGVYALVMARNDARIGPQLRQASGDCARTRDELASRGNGARACGLNFGLGAISGARTSMAAFAFSLAPTVGRMVIDKTGLTGDFDLDLRFTPDATLGLGAAAGGPQTIDANGPSLFTALQEQLGLKLESQRTLVEVLVVEQAARPSAN